MLQALSIHEGIVAELTRARALRVHSVFDRAVNLDAPTGLIALAARELPNAPRTVVVDVAGFADAGLRPGAVARFGDRGIRLGGLAIGTGGASLWRPALPSAAPAPGARAALEAALLRHGAAGGCLAAPEEAAAGRPAGAAPDPFAVPTPAALAALERACRSGSDAELAHAASRLVGLGVGLTPAGDDALVGALVAGHWLGGRAARLAPAVASLDLDARTTPIGAAALRSALAGEGPEPLHALLAALASTAEPASADPARRTTAAAALTPLAAAIDAATADLVAIGHTSGTDLVCGALTALRLGGHAAAAFRNDHTAQTPQGGQPW